MIPSSSSGLLINIKQARLSLDSLTLIAAFSRVPHVLSSLAESFATLFYPSLAPSNSFRRRLLHRPLTARVVFSFFLSPSAHSLSTLLISSVFQSGHNPRRLDISLTAESSAHLQFISQAASLYLTRKELVILLEGSHTRIEPILVSPPSAFIPSLSIRIATLAAPLFSRQ